MILILIGLISGIGAILLIRKGTRDKSSDLSNITFIPDKINEGNEKDDLETNGLDFDKIIKIVTLRNKLKIIKEQRSQTKKENS
jgi:hypothetical protein